MYDTSDTNAPVITVDGPSGTGKGTVTHWLAQRLGWHWLDSGAWYRIVAWFYLQGSYAVLEDFITAMVTDIDLQAIAFKRDAAGINKILCGGADITIAIRSEVCAQQASKLSAMAPVRQLLLDIQRNYRRMPGLVADGRDMGTVIFPEASLKLYLTASPEARAKRRYHQLLQQGQSAELDELVKMLRERDERDATRAIAACRPAADAVILDTSELNIQQVQTEVWQQVESRQLNR